MATEEVAGRSFSIGAVFNRAFGVMGRNPLVSFGTAFLLGALPAAVLSYATTSFTVDMQQRGVFAGFVTSVIFGGVIYLLLRSIVQGCMVRATVADGEGRKADLGECLDAAFKRLMPLIGASILYALAVGFGLMLLVVPGLMVAVAYAVLIPVTVEERVSIGSAFSRAADLTRGARWKVFGLLVVMGVILWLLYAVVGLVQVLVIGGMPSAATPNFTPGLLVLSALATTISVTFWSTMITGLYVELRDWKDGPVEKRLNEIFE